MKLHSDFIAQDMGGEYVLVPVGKAAESFHGIARGNATTGFILSCLAEDTSRDAIVDALQRKYDAPRDRIESSVDKVLTALRSIGALVE